MSCAQGYGLNVVQDEIAEEPQPEVVALVSSLPDICAHTFLDSHDSDEPKRNYLLLLALCVENSASLNGLAREFIALLAEKSGFPELQEEILELADNPSKDNEYRSVMQALINDDNKIYTWLLDAFFLLTLTQKAIENPQIKAIIGTLRPAQLKKCIPNMLVIINSSDESSVLEAALRLAPYTQGWKNTIRYRRLCFDQYFAETARQLNAASWAYTRLVIEMNDVYRKGMEHSVFFRFSDGSFLSNVTDKAASAACTLGRKSAQAGLNEFRKNAGDFISANRFALSQANGVISRWNIPSFEFKDVSHYSDFDLDNSADNEDWGDQFEHYYRQVEDTLNSFSQACEGAMEQIGLFTQGTFDQSVLKIREQKRAEHLRQQELEKLEKLSVTIMKDGKEHLLSIEWQQVESPPCNPENISNIKTDGKIWLIVANVDSDELFYRSEDGVNWLQVQLDTPNIKIFFDGVYFVNGMWIIKNRELREGTREEGFYYSADAIAWRHCPAPEPSKRALSINDGHMFFENILYFNGLWLWCGQQYQKYSYTEKGFFSDSTKTDSYKRIIFYCAQTLDGPWQSWGQTPQLSEGGEVKTVCSLPGKNALLAFCEYNSSFIRNKKKPETPPFVMYYGAAKNWKNCTWGGSTNFRYSSNPPILTNNGDKLICFSSGEILSSDKGYEWSKQETTL